MTVTTAPTLRRVAALTRRAWIQQGTVTVWLAALVGAGLGVLVLLGVGGATTLTDSPELVPNTPDALASIRDADGAFLPMASYLLVMTPALLGMLVAVVATLTLPGVVADDITGGGIEVLLAGPIPRRSLFTAYLGAGLVLSFAAWAIATGTFTLAALITAAVIGASLTMSWVFVVALLVVPLSMCLWSATATLFGALLYPRSLDSRAGINGGPIRLLAILPALIAVPSVLLPSQVLPGLGLVLVVTVVASVVVLRLTARRFRSTRVLGG